MVEAEAGEFALAGLDCNAEISVVFTDIRMPRQFDGLALAHKVHKQWPDIQLIIASGKAELTSAELPSKSTFLAKPYDCMEIVSLIRANTCELLHRQVRLFASATS